MDEARPDPFAAQPAPSRKPLRALAVVMLGLIVVNLGLLVWLFLRGATPRPLVARTQLRPIELHLPAPSLGPLPKDLTTAERRTIEVFEKNAPSVVFVTNLSVRRNRLTRNIMEIPRGTGSGFVWDQQGHIVTNFHVVRKGNAARVTFSDQDSHEAELVGVAPAKDLAVLKVDAPKNQLAPLPRGSSSTLRVGQFAMAIGNPFGLDHTLSTGVISGLEREIKSLVDRPIFGVIQTDAAINPGNSGGPLIDSRGKLIGINTAIYSPSGASAGIGFAVPVDTVERIVPQLIEHGKVLRPGLGITFDPGFNRRVQVDGVVILGVQPGSAAEKAGLEPAKRDSKTGDIILGDIIVGIDGEKVESEKDLYKILDLRKVGETLTLEVLRGRKRVELEVTLEALD